MNVFALGIELMCYGLLGVFSVLILFYILIRLLVKIFPFKEDQNN